MSQQLEQLRHPIKDWMNPETKMLREHAADWLVELVEEGILGDITVVDDLFRNAKPLTKGTRLACFIVKSDQHSRVVRFNMDDVSIEVASMKRWQQKGAKVPSIDSHGIVPSTMKRIKPIRYMLMEAILD